MLRGLASFTDATLEIWRSFQKLLSKEPDANTEVNRGNCLTICGKQDLGMHRDDIALVTGPANNTLAGMVEETGRTRLGYDSTFERRIKGKYISLNSHKRNWRSR